MKRQRSPMFPTVYTHVCPACGVKFPSLREKLDEGGFFGPLCADCYAKTLPPLERKEKIA